MDYLNRKTELLKQTHILKDHLNGKTELLKQTHIQIDFPFQWNWMGWDEMSWVSIELNQVVRFGSEP